MFKAMALNTRLTMPNPGANFQIDRQIDAYMGEFAQLKPDSYRELQYAIRHLWNLQVMLAQDQLRVIQRDEDKAEGDLNQKWNNTSGELGKKWVAVWEQQLAAQKTSHKTKARLDGPTRCWACATVMILCWNRS